MGTITGTSRGYAPFIRTEKIHRKQSGLSYFSSFFFGDPDSNRCILTLKLFWGKNVDSEIILEKYFFYFENLVEKKIETVREKI